MTLPAYIWHATLNTGMGRRMLRAEIPDEAIAAVRPLIASDGLRRDAVPELAFDLVVTRTGPALYCTAKLPRHDAAVFVVAGRWRGPAARWWRELHDAPLDAYATDPADAPQAPWLAVALAAEMRQQPREATLGCIGLAKACAWAWLEMLEEA